jgi:hypothetical protein
MLEMGTSGLMSGVGKRGDALAPAPASGLDSTDLPGIPRFSSYDFPGATSTQAYGISARGEIAGRCVVGA